jgi:hypothetical protein
MTLDLTDEERLALAAELKRTIAEIVIRYRPGSAPLQSILDKLEPRPPREPLPEAKTLRRALLGPHPAFAASQQAQPAARQSPASGRLMCCRASGSRAGLVEACFERIIPRPAPVATAFIFGGTVGRHRHPHRTLDAGGTRRANGIHRSLTGPSGLAARHCSVATTRKEPKVF